MLHCLQKGNDNSNRKNYETQGGGGEEGGSGGSRRERSYIEAVSGRAWAKEEEEKQESRSTPENLLVPSSISLSISRLRALSCQFTLPNQP